jgi:hypothetical protein
MAIPGAVGLGALVSVGVLVLVVFVVVFMRLERTPKPFEENRPPPPLGWPISPEASAALRPHRSSAAASLPDRS